jgi:hypothetical protein
VFALQVWATVSSEDFRATLGVVWGSVARWAVATTVHFELSDAVVLLNFIPISLKDNLFWFCLLTFGAFIC